MLPISELFGEREGTPFSATKEREYTRRYRILARSKLEDPISIASHPRLPRPYSFYANYNGSVFDVDSLLVKRTAKEEHKDDWQSWIVTDSYSTQMPPGGPNQAQQQNQSQGQPQNDPVTAQWGSETANLALKHDYDGRPWVNTAYAKFKPSPTVKVVRPTLTITRNELTWGVEKSYQWSNTVNILPFLDIPFSSVYCEAPTAEEKWEGNIRYWRVTYKLLFGARFPNPIILRTVQHRMDGANVMDPANNVPIDKVLEYEDLGYEYIIDAGLSKIAQNGPNAGKAVGIRREAHQVVDEVMLDGKGNELEGNLPPALRPPTYLRFNITGGADFNDLLVAWVP